MREFYKDPIKYGKRKAQSLIYGRRIRAAALAYLGGKCNRCEFTDPRALQIDHINGGGVQEARRIGNNGIERNVLKGLPGYQLLCANCNWIKRCENGEYNKSKRF